MPKIRKCDDRPPGGAGLSPYDDQETDRGVARAVDLDKTLLAGPWSTGAHHGTNISYDRSGDFTAQAVVTEFQYRNPHPELHVDLKDDKGAVVRLVAGEAAEPRTVDPERLEPRQGQRGDEAGHGWSFVTIAPSKAGGVVGLLLRVTTPSGEELVTGGGGPGGRQGDPDAGRQAGPGRGNRRGAAPRDEDAGFASLASI